MRIAGALTLAATGLIVVLLAVLPTSITVLGTSASCGPPVITTFASSAGHANDPFTESAVEQCAYQSLIQLFAAGVVLVIGGVSGATMLAVGAPRDRQRHLWPAYGSDSPYGPFVPPLPATAKPPKQPPW